MMPFRKFGGPVKSPFMKWLFLLIGAVGLTGCSSFHKEWRTANKAPVPANSIEGPWQGGWRSEQNGHHGALRCVVTKTSEGAFRAHYRATYAKIFHFTYVTTLNGRETNGVVALQGEADLGKLAGGVYTYQGTATSTHFHSAYSSKYDHGEYDMSRPTP
jgi:hypothetical protein